MSQASAWRLRFAQHLAPIYAMLPDVSAVLLGGSASRGWADRYSDIEIGVFWKNDPTDEQRIRIAQQAGGERIRADSYDPEQGVWLEDYVVDGVSIDVVHRTVGATEQLITDVLTAYDITDYKQTLLAALQDAIPLSGGEVIERWQAQIASYPDGLMLVMLDTHLRFNPWWYIEVFALRNDFVLVYQALSTVSQRLFYALVALNKHYYPGMKWISKHLEQLVIGPPSFAARLQRCFDGEMRQGVQDMRTLVEETFALAAMYAPSIDWAVRQERFRSVRTPVDGPPPTLL
jgi:hypothetical protein